MTRMTICTEGAKVNNCVVLPGALYVEDDVIPVIWDGDHNHLIGRASAFQREGDLVTMEILLDPRQEIDLEKDCEAYVYVQPFEAKKNALISNAISEVVKGRVRAVCIQMKNRGANPPFRPADPTMN